MTILILLLAIKVLWQFIAWTIVKAGVVTKQLIYAVQWFQGTKLVKFTCDPVLVSFREIEIPSGDISNSRKWGTPFSMKSTPNCKFLSRPFSSLWTEMVLWFHNKWYCTIFHKRFNYLVFQFSHNNIDHDRSKRRAHAYTIFLFLNNILEGKAVLVHVSRMSFFSEWFGHSIFVWV